MIENNSFSSEYNFELAPLNRKIMRWVFLPIKLKLPIKTVTNHFYKVTINGFYKVFINQYKDYFRKKLNFENKIYRYYSHISHY